MPRHPANHNSCQTFRFLTHCWCISQALQLIKADPNTAQFIEQADITSLDNYIDLNPARPGTMRLLVVEIDRDYALTRTDLTTPILLTRITADRKDLGLLVIDGWHRVYRARVEGRTHLPAYLLTAETELATRITVPRR